MYSGLHRAADLLARSLAYAGGAILLILIGMNCVSIVGRAFVPLDIGISPILGIYDITEMGMAAAVFAFLPWAQLREAHARVDLFQAALPRKLDQTLDLVFNAAMAFVAVVGTWRLYLGMQDRLAYGDIMLIAEIPVWQGYAVALIGAVGFVIVALFCVLRAGRRLAGIEGRKIQHV